MISSHNRCGETGETPPRFDRVFKEDNYWYFTTREGPSMGPFDCANDAAVSITDYINFIVDADISTRQFLAHVHAA